LCLRRRWCYVEDLGLQSGYVIISTLHIKITFTNDNKVSIQRTISNHTLKEARLYVSKPARSRRKLVGSRQKKKGVPVRCAW
jgi:hypothetical protein